MLRLTLLLCSFAAFASAGTDPGETIEPLTRRAAQRVRFARSFQPLLTSIAALSPDGKHLAYTIREQGAVFIIVVDLNNPGTALSKTLVVTDKAASPYLDDNIYEKTPAVVRKMIWVTPNRLVAETNRSYTYTRQVLASTEHEWEERQNISEETEESDGGQHESPQNISGQIIALNADGTDARPILSPNDVHFTVFSEDHALRKELGLVSKSAWGPTGLIGRKPEDPISTGASGAPKEELKAGSIPTSPRLFDLDPEHPDSVIVHCGTEQAFQVVRLNAITGEITRLSQERAAGEMAILTDRQSRGRAAVPVSIVRPFPHRYVVDRSALRWTELDKILPERASAPFILSPDNFFGQRSFPVGFDEDPHILYYASNQDRETYGLYSVNIKTGEPGAVTVENPAVDLIEPSPAGFGVSPLIFDRYSRRLSGIRYAREMRTTAWLHPDWQNLQNTLESLLPGQIVDILEWDASASRFLLLARGTTNPGAFFVYEPAKQRLYQIAPRAPWLDESHQHRTVKFALTGPAGTPVTGLLTIPRHSRLTPVPIVALCPPEPWQRTSGEFHGEVHALAEMGFAILQVNPRGASGFGRKHREAVLSAPGGFESPQTDDIIAAIDHLARKFPVSTKHVAVMGQLRGGYLALRALQLRPDRFRCVVALDPTVNLQNWLAENRWSERLAAPALVRPFFGKLEPFHSAVRDQPEKFTRPVMILHYPGPESSPRSFPFIAAQQLHGAIRSAGGSSEFVTLGQDHARGHPEARSDTFARIEDFLNENIYRYDVQLGETEVKDVDSIPPRKTQ